MGRLLQNSDAPAAEVLSPVIQCSFGDGERYPYRLSTAPAAPGGAGPGKEGENRAGPSQFISIVEMVGIWIVEVDGELHQPQAQQTGVEIDILLRIAGDGCDMMNTMKEAPYRRLYQRTIWRLDWLFWTNYLDLLVWPS